MTGIYMAATLSIPAPSNRVLCLAYLHLISISQRSSMDYLDSRTSE